MLMIESGKVYRGAALDGRGDIAHMFDEKDVRAIKTAYFAKRPLLLRGEPGVGKTQLAIAAALATQSGFVQHVVDLRTEPRDLLWRDDPVARLADAQMIGALGASHSDEAREIQHRLKSRSHYVTPGVFWWAYSWNTAAGLVGDEETKAPAQMQGCSAKNGVVVLVDEIDKAETDLPNGLLEVLGARRFTPSFQREPVVATTWPLVVVTSNEERELPAAFVRRCVVHHMELPGEEQLINRCLAHFDGGDRPKLDKTVVEAAVSQLLHDRSEAEKAGRRIKPGQAELIDMLNAVSGFGGNLKEQTDRVQELREYVFQKNLKA